MCKVKKGIGKDVSQVDVENNRDWWRVRERQSMEESLTKRLEEYVVSEKEQETERNK